VRRRGSRSAAMITCFQDVIDQLLPLAPTLTEKDIADIVLTVYKDPSAGPDILAAYAAANVDNDPDWLVKVWGVVQEAASIASVISAIGGVAML
jgi:hypothetical protein